MPTMPHRLIEPVSPSAARVLGLGLTAAANVMSWAESLSVGTVASAITLIGGATLLFMEKRATIATKAYIERERARIDLRAEEDLRLKDSLSTQLQDARAAVQRAEQSASAAKAEAAESRKEAAQARREAADATHELMEMIRASTERTVRHTDANRQNIEALRVALEKAEREAMSRAEDISEPVHSTATKVTNIEKIVTGGSSDTLPATGGA